MEERVLQLGEFHFLIPLAKALEEEGKLIVEGVASDPQWDLYEERISLDGIDSMVACVRAGAVTLGGEADHWVIGFDDDLGKVVEATNDGGNFRIRAELDSANARAVSLHKMLKTGKKLGLSVFGGVPEDGYHYEGVKLVIDKVNLTRIMVTQSPVNPRTWTKAVGKSISLKGGGSMEKSGAVEARPPLEVAKGAFNTAFQDWMDWKARISPQKAAFAQVEYLEKLAELLWEATSDIFYAWGLLTDQEKLSAFEEAKGEFLQKIQEAMTPGGEAAAIEGGTDELLEDAVEEEMGMSQTQTPDPAAVAKAQPAPEPAPAQAVVPPAPVIPQARPVAKSGQTLGSVAAALTAGDDEPATSQPVSGTAKSLSQVAALLTDEPEPAREAAKSTEMPAWAQALVEKINNLESAFTAKSAPIAATVADSAAGTDDQSGEPIVAKRKSLTPEDGDQAIRPSRVVTAKTLRDTVSLLVTPQVNSIGKPK